MAGERRFVVGVGGAFELTDDTPVYVISVAAQLAGMHPQTLRQYDRLGLVSPGRAGGGGRRYSLRDIERLREVQRLSQEEGVNLAGVKRVIELEDEVHLLRTQVVALSAALQSARAELARLVGARAALPARTEVSGMSLTWRSEGH